LTRSGWSRLKHNRAPFDVESGEASLDFKP
jgi:hypothetical protein